MPHRANASLEIRAITGSFEFSPFNCSSCDSYAPECYVQHDDRNLSGAFVHAIVNDPRGSAPCQHVYKHKYTVTSSMEGVSDRNFRLCFLFICLLIFEFLSFFFSFFSFLRKRGFRFVEFCLCNAVDNPRRVTLGACISFHGVDPHPRAEMKPLM